MPEEATYTRIRPGMAPSCVSPSVRSRKYRQIIVRKPGNMPSTRIRFMISLRPRKRMRDSA